MSYERDYANLVKATLNQPKRATRNADTRSHFGATLVVDELVHGHFPILQGRKIFHKGVLGELAAMFKGPKSLKDFTDEGCNYWGKWAKPDGSIELDYGNKWLDFHGFNQLEALVEGLKNDPNGRRHIVTGWDPSNLKNVDLPCCHMLYQWYVTNDGYLEMIWYQRSVDLMVGMPSDVIVAAAWNIALANQVGLKPGRLIFMLGDVHIYDNHLSGALDYLVMADYITGDAPLSLPIYSASEDISMDNFSSDSIAVLNYKPQTKINFEVHA